jgi:acetylornithine deacetylase/succinyl-diaminopimelate desuccinylase-like protein
VLGLDTVFFSFSSGDENLHAPNEFFRVARLREGLHAWAHLLALLASVPESALLPGRRTA